jgi:hypothetical protein
MTDHDRAIRSTAARLFRENGFNAVRALNAVRRDTALGVIEQAQIAQQIARFSTGDDPVDLRSS